MPWPYCQKDRTLGDSQWLRLGPLGKGAQPCWRSGMKYRELVALIEDDGWHLIRQRGSHRQYRHKTKSGFVTIAGKPANDVPKGTKANILRQAGLHPRR